MNYPSVTERKVPLEPVVHDPFGDKLPAPAPPAKPAAPPRP